VNQNETRCKDHIISEVMFDRMLNASEPLPPFIYYTPGIAIPIILDMLNDCHDFDDMTFCDAYLPTLLETFDKIEAADDQRTLFLVTFDEDNWQILDPNHIHTVVWGAGLPKGVQDNIKYNHFSLPATVLANWGLEPLYKRDVGATILKLKY
jgi:hypothetical protein